MARWMPHMLPQSLGLGREWESLELSTVTWQRFKVEKSEVRWGSGARSFLPNSLPQKKKGEGPASGNNKWTGLD